MTIFTAIFGSYDDLKEPKVITPGWEYVCFTDQDLKSDVWKIIRIDTQNLSPQLKARYYKIQGHSLFVDDTIWIDASFIINCDLTKFWGKNATGPMTFCRHPFRSGVHEEILACVQQMKAPDDKLMLQWQALAADGIPQHAPVAATGLIMRFYDDKTDDFCRKWWLEVQKHTCRDQISWAKIAYETKGINMIDWDYFNTMEFIHIPHLNNPKREARIQDLKQKGIL